MSYKRARLKENLLPREDFASGGSITVEYVYAFANIRGSYLRRYWYFLTFVLSAFLKALRLPRPDVIYAVSTPLSVGLLGAGLLKRWGIPMFFEVTDAWPDAAVAVGVLRSRVMIAVARMMERVCYAAAHEIVCLTQGIRENIARKGVPASKLRIVTNGVDLALFATSPQRVARRAQLRADWGVSDRLVCMYMGAHGAYNALHTIIDAAVRLRMNPRVAFVFVGEGDVKPELCARVGAERLGNVAFLGLFLRSDTPDILGAADCFLLPILRGDFYDLNLPNKFFDYLASSAPILVSGLARQDGWWHPPGLEKSCLRRTATPWHTRSQNSRSARLQSGSGWEREGEHSRSVSSPAAPCLPRCSTQSSVSAERRSYRRHNQSRVVVRHLAVDRQRNHALVRALALREHLGAQAEGVAPIRMQV